MEDVVRAGIDKKLKKDNLNVTTSQNKTELTEKEQDQIGKISILNLEERRRERTQRLSPLNKFRPYIFLIWSYSGFVNSLGICFSSKQKTTITFTAVAYALLYLRTVFHFGW